MHMSNIPPEKLIVSNKKQRFLEELEAHADDAGQGANLGSALDLAETFNGYARPKRNLRIAIIIFIALYAGIADAFLLHGELWENNHTFPDPTLTDQYPILGVILLYPGLFFHLPVAALFIPASLLFPSMMLDAIFPFITALAWGGLTTLICFPPAWLKKIVRRQKYDAQ